MEHKIDLVELAAESTIAWLVAAPQCSACRTVFRWFSRQRNGAPLVRSIDPHFDPRAPPLDLGSRRGEPFGFNVDSRLHHRRQRSRLAANSAPFLRI